MDLKKYCCRSRKLIVMVIFSYFYSKAKKLALTDGETLSSPCLYGLYYESLRVHIYLWLSYMKRCLIELYLVCLVYSNSQYYSSAARIIVLMQVMQTVTGENTETERTQRQREHSDREKQGQRKQRQRQRKTET